MTAAPPPGWYQDPNGRGRRYWEGEAWSDHVLAEGVAPPLFDGQQAAGQPRRLSIRVILTIVLVVASYAIATLAGELVTRLVVMVIGPIGGAPGEDLGKTVQLIVVAVLAGWAATRVSYRWFDFLFLLIPFYGFYLTFRIAWRICYLPYRDWTPRVEEAAGWRQVVHPTSPGELLYRLSAGSPGSGRFQRGGWEA